MELGEGVEEGVALEPAGVLALEFGEVGDQGGDGGAYVGAQGGEGIAASDEAGVCLVEGVHHRGVDLAMRDARRATNSMNSRPPRV